MCFSTFQPTVVQSGGYISDAVLGTYCTLIVAHLKMGLNKLLLKILLSYIDKKSVAILFSAVRVIMKSSVLPGDGFLSVYPSCEWLAVATMIYVATSQHRSSHLDTVYQPGMCVCSHINFISRICLRSRLDLTVSHTHWSDKKGNLRFICLKNCF